VKGAFDSGIDRGSRGETTHEAGDFDVGSIFGIHEAGYLVRDVFETTHEAGDFDVGSVFGNHEAGYLVSDVFEAAHEAGDFDVGSIFRDSPSRRLRE
jgi:hypothetical protein